MSASGVGASIATIVGARPQFIKCSLLSHELRRRGLRERLIHTGQHYDDRLSDLFFRELEIPEPALNLGVGSDSHARQTARIMIGLEAEFIRERPDLVIVFGDTNSTVAGALTAVKMDLALAHVEAGLRGFNRMPEEHNRIVADHLSDLLICHNEAAAQRLRRREVRGRAVVCGDTMRETAEHFLPRALERPWPAGLEPGAKFALLTVHRPANADRPESLAEILRAAGRLPMPVIFPVHPRTEARIAALGEAMPANVRAIGPVGYLDMLGLVARAALVLTDSGGLQKEAVILGTPCVTLRGDTEWLETIELGLNTLAGEPARAEVILEKADAALALGAGETREARRARLAPEVDRLFGPADVARRVADAVEEFLG